jgi:hypothetical protein
MRSFEMLPDSRHRTASLTRRGAISVVAGIVVLSASMFAAAPLPLLLLVSLGGILILAGCITGVTIALFSPFRGER